MAGVMDLHERYREWIELELDEQLGDVEAEELAMHLAGCAACRRERDASARLFARLDSARLAVRPRFAMEVLAALEPAPWEARAPRSWKLPVAVLTAVGGLAAVLFGLGAAGFQPQGGSSGALAALLDLFRAALVAGSGLASASWGAAGEALGAWLGRSTLNWGAAAMLALGADYLLVRLLRSRSAAAGESARRDASH